MVFHIAMEQKRFPNWQELEHAIRRNFGGLLEEDFNPVRVIMTHLRFPPEYLQVSRLECSKYEITMLLINPDFHNWRSISVPYCMFIDFAPFSSILTCKANERMLRGTTGDYFLP